MAQCSSCQAAIAFAKLDDGQTIPLNARRARAYVLETLDGQIHASRIVVPIHKKDVDLFYVSHFLSCPNASRHSKKKTGRTRGESEEHLQACLDLLERLEPFFSRATDSDEGARFQRVLRAHYRHEGRGCSGDELRAWLEEIGERARAMLKAEGREPSE